MHDTRKPAQVLPLEGNYNTRDIGGYPTADGGKTAWGVCLRGDSLSELTAADLKLLKDYGVSCVVDLRGTSERALYPDGIAEEPWVEYHPVSLLDNLQSNGFSGEDLPNTLGDMYLDLLHFNGAEFARAASYIAGTSGVTLFHCAAGKDRTGMLSMLLLDLAEVEPIWILKDYLPSGKNYRPEADRKLGEIPDGIRDRFYKFFVSRVEDFEPAYRYIQVRYGNAASYFLAHGMDQETLERLKYQLVHGK